MARQYGGAAPLKPEELRDKALAIFDKKVVRIEDTFVRLVKLLDRAVEQLQTHMFEGLGYKPDAPIDEKTVKLLREVTAAANSAADAQVRLDKTAGQRAKQMSHEDRKKAVSDFIMTLPSRERAEWIVALVEAHNEFKAVSGRGGRPLLGTPDPASAIAGLSDEEDVK